MKKFIKSLMFFAVAAMTFTSCQNEIFDNDFQAEDTYTMTFVADAPQTRTSVTIKDGIAKFAWKESGEYVAFVQWDSNWETNASETAKSNYKKSKEGVVTDNKAEFGAEFKTIEGATKYGYIAVYPFDNFVSQDVTNDYIRVKVPASQTLTPNTFDPNADLLISKPINNGETMMGNADVVSMEFARVASIAKMTLKGIENDEMIKSVTFIWGSEKKDSANEGNRFVGKYEFNFEGNVTNAAFEGQNYVELTTATGISAVKAGTDIYFTCLPGAYSGTYTIEVVTDKATYKKSAVLDDEKALNFTSGKVLSFGLAFGENHREAIKVTGYYRKVTSTLADFSGEYLIVYEGGNVAFDGSKTILDATSNTINVKIADGAIEATDVVKESAFTIAKSGNGYTIKSASGYYIGRTATKNGLESSTTTAYTNSISIENGSAVVKSSANTYLKYNKASDQKRFRYFGSGQEAIQLYKLDDGTTPEPEQPGQGGGETPDPDPEQPGQGGGSASVTETVDVSSLYTKTTELVNKTTPTATFDWGSSVFNFTITRESSSNTQWNGGVIRFYQNDNLLIDAGSKKITRIEFTTTGEYVASRFSINSGGGTMNDGVWTGSSSQVEFNADKQVRFSKIVITYTE